MIARADRALLQEQLGNAAEAQRDFNYFAERALIRANSTAKRISTSYASSNAVPMSSVSFQLSAPKRAYSYHTQRMC